MGCPRSFWMFPYVLREPMPSGSKTDLLLVMGGPISDGGRDTERTQLGKGEKSCTTAAR